MPPASQHKNEWVETINNLGIDVGKKKCRAALKDERGENMWIRIHDTLEENRIDTILANPYKTKIIAKAKLKFDKLDAKILSFDFLGRVLFISLNIEQCACRCVARFFDNFCCLNQTLACFLVTI